VGRNIVTEKIIYVKYVDVNSVWTIRK